MTEKTSVGIGLINPKSPTNVGAIMRAAGCFGANYVLYTGQRYSKAAKFHTDTKQASQHIPLSGVDDLATAVSAGVKIVCVDLIEGAVALPDFTHPEHALYVFGPEDGTINQSIIDAADAAVYIPTKGCLNLAATVNVVLYDRQAKNLTSLSASGDELIRASRDVNNRVAFKSQGANR
ncbi:RNA methyltransferase [Saccharophagus degradans]|uniref:RNA methyltransferase n=1 Tax=Saccharophagus degradans TaxID=86304 RepID=A0AAW7XCT3_9GAMM|nr:RNA methyltransferase [Saccharophagus degradans]MDO6424333.1 RNA methyltransferase [Saccharophagus degradans]MDO6608460.1 RNA methyltransferase [Saccharophagus degradans]